jgi:capsular polysaccharide biosynthesis protein
MGKTFALNSAKQCNYAPHMRNLWNLPMQRLQTYCESFMRPGDYYKVSPQASCIGDDWIGLERYLIAIEETIPFRLLSHGEHIRLVWRHLKGRTAEMPYTACVLIDYLNRKPNYFHWFLDALPRVFAAEDYEKLSGVPCYFIVPEVLKTWQWDSIRMLGIPEERIITIRNSHLIEGYSFNHLISTFSHRHIRHSLTGHFDSFSPEMIQKLSERLSRAPESHQTASTTCTRLYVSRGHAHQRRVCNEDKIMEILSPHGFQLVYLDKLTLHDQIKLFRNATHVIAPHGGALTNLLHLSPGCQVLEVFQSGHGERPDFFQLAALKGATYSFAVATSLNQSHDIDIPAAVLHTFLEASL